MSCACTDRICQGGARLSAKNTDVEKHNVLSEFLLDEKAALYDKQILIIIDPTVKGNASPRCAALKAFGMPNIIKYNVVVQQEGDFLRLAHVATNAPLDSKDVTKIIYVRPEESDFTKSLLNENYGNIAIVHFNPSVAEKE
jgi:hypothetical protein